MAHFRDFGIRTDVPERRVLKCLFPDVTHTANACSEGVVRLPLFITETIRLFDCADDLLTKAVSAEGVLVPVKIATSQFPGRSKDFGEMRYTSQKGDDHGSSRIRRHR